MLSEYRGSPHKALWLEMRTMGLRQNLYRIYYELAGHIGLHRRRFRTEAISDAALFEEFGGRCDSAAALLAYLRSRPSPRFFFSHSDRGRYEALLSARFASQRQRCLELADAVCRRHFELLGTVEDFGDEIDWHRLPGGGRSWPRTAWWQIDIRCPNAIGEVKTTWELNRHQFWLHLGRAYWWTGDERYAREWVAQLRSWIDENPPEVGVNWLSNLEVAVRSISWIWALEYFLDSPSLSPELVRDMLRTLLHAARHLRTDIAHSLYVQPSNHLIGDAAGLVFIATYFPEFRQSPAWLRYGLRTLWDWLPRLVRPDGTIWEQATSYHRFVLYFYIMVDRLVRLNGIEPPPIVRQRMERMIDHTAALLKPDRAAVVFGDCDDAKAVFLSNDEPQNYLPTLSTGAVLMERGDWKYLAGDLSEETLWLLGPDALDAWDRLEAHQPEAGQAVFPDGGTYVSRDGWGPRDNFIFVHCGPFTGHRMGHLAHLELAVDGQSVLGGTGTYTYNGPWHWRTYFRQSSAHNTVTVDGHGQALSHRSFRFLFEPRDIRGAMYRTGDAERIDVGHTSFRFLDGGIRHRRIVHFVHGAFYLVIDQLDGPGEHAFAQHWHFEPGPVELDDRGTAVRMLPSGLKFSVIPMARNGLSWSLIEGSTDPIQGWRSPSFGRKEPAPCLTYAWRDACPTLMATLLAVSTADDRPSLAKEDQVAGTRSGAAFRVTVGGVAHPVAVG